MDEITKVKNCKVTEIKDINFRNEVDKKERIIVLFSSVGFLKINAKGI